MPAAPAPDYKGLLERVVLINMLKQSQELYLRGGSGPQVDTALTDATEAALSAFGYGGNDEITMKKIIDRASVLVGTPLPK